MARTPENLIWSCMFKQATDECLRQLFTMRVVRLHPPRQGSKPGWTGLRATWPSGRCPCSWQVGWKEMIFKVPSNPKHSVILSLRLWGTTHPPLLAAATLSCQLRLVTSFGLKPMIHVVRGSRLPGGRCGAGGKADALLRPPPRHLGGRSCQHQSIPQPCLRARFDFWQEHDWRFWLFTSKTSVLD